MGKYNDLLITNNDITLGTSGVAIETHVSDRPSIAQDMVHMIRESGLLVSLVGQRNREAVQMNMTRIEQMMEDDERIVPGSAKVTRTDTETFWITAKTVDYGNFEVYL